MAAFDYAGLKVVVDELLAEFGQVCEIRKPGAPVTVNPVEGTVTSGATESHLVVGCVVDFTEKLVESGAQDIIRGDRQAYIQANVEPEIGDLFVEANGTQWVVIDIRPVNPAGVSVVCALHLRR